MTSWAAAPTVMYLDHWGSGYRYWGGTPTTRGWHFGWTDVDYGYAPSGSSEFFYLPTAAPIATPVTAPAPLVPNTQVLTPEPILEGGEHAVMGPAPAATSAEGSLACTCPCGCGQVRACQCAYPCGTEYTISEETFRVTDGFVSSFETLPFQAVSMAYAGLLDEWE